jgi:hypothetical protein
MAEPLSDRIKGALLALVRSATRRYDYFALYPCRVLSQNADGTLELVPDDETMPGQSHVPLRLGLPGVSVKVKTGARVLLGYEAGDPQRPVATVWEAAGLERITITADTAITAIAPSINLGEGGLPIARQGDLVAVGGLTTIVSFVEFPPVVPPAAAPMQTNKLYKPIWSNVANPTQTGPTLYGAVMTGSPKAKAAG